MQKVDRAEPTTLQLPWSGRPARPRVCNIFRFLAETPHGFAMRLVALVVSESAWLRSPPAASADSEYTRYPSGLEDLRASAFETLPLFDRNAGRIRHAAHCTCCWQICSVEYAPGLRPRPRDTSAGPKEPAKVYFTACHC